MSAIQQAQKMFQKLVDNRINSAATPQPQMRSFQVATLPGGKTLLSDGTIRTAFPFKRVVEGQQQAFDQMKSPQATQQIAKNINMEVTTPARNIALGGESGQNMFVNLLAKLIQPKLQGAPEIGPLTALLPGMQDKIQPILKTSAFTNLPDLSPEVKSLFDDTAGFYKKFMAGAGGIQDALAKDFIANYTNREQPVVNAGMVQRALPMISNYQNRFGIPSANNARYAQIGTNVNEFNQRI